MSRYIEVEKAMELCDEFYFSDETCSVKALFNSAPSIDICRCAECKHYDTDVWTARHWCGRVSSIGNCKYVNPDDFCSYGERKER